jgi:hypothetical protein
MKGAMDLQISVRSVNKNIYIYILVEHRGRVINTASSYTGGPGIKAPLS